ncbi:triose or hexose phosphate/phosphate translocator, putative [Plasmodium relictum]|uniref:Triose or hexose phosphate/phosphate translocator, putative n=1 Tax=Plasmodium relictum TaxID=85471 RepID=A0A1J1HB09_PLARL|nr:triose or hexose phosphate/phosphate translocator, putative [Plasmodium relictum]CRH02612.1 triose or hexose phosphate/phosphate translocator, putative [Plasmodium relictum]
MKYLINKYNKDEEKNNSINKKNDVDIENLTVNGININDININDIDESIIDTKETKDKKNTNAIEYYLFDIGSYNNSTNINSENFVDLSSIKSSYLSENRKKKAKKKKGNYIKKQLKLYKKKYKILPEHNLDQDTNYEESIGNGNGNGNKNYKIYDLKEIKDDKGISDIIQPKLKDSFNVKKDIFLGVIKFIILVSSIFSLGSVSTAITKYIIFVKKFKYTQIVTFFEFLIMYIILRLVIFFSKMKSSTDLTKKDYIKYIISISALLGLGSVTGVGAYYYLEIPIISVFKSSSLIFIYFLSIRFGLKEFKCSILFSIITILIGVIMSITTLKIDSFFGIFLLVISVISSSFKWVFTNLLLKSTSIKPHIILLHIYQVAMLIILLPSFFIDLTSIIKDYNNKVLTIEQIYITLILVTLSALTSIFLILAEFSLISHTSSVTLSVIFIGREAIILIIGSIFFGDKINLSSSIGIAISMIGTVLYGYASK